MAEIINKYGFRKDSSRIKGTGKVNDHIEWEGEERGWAHPAWTGKGQHVSSEYHYLYRTALRLGKGNMANLVVLRGASTHAIARGAFPNGGHVYGIDLFNIASKRIDPDKMSEKFKEAGLIVTICKGLTSEWAEKLSHLKFNFIFVDANHHYENCKEDFELWSPLLEEGGEIAFHDVDMDSVDKVCRDMIDDGWEQVDHVYRIKSFKRRGESHASY